MSFIVVRENGLSLIQPDWPDLPANVHAFSSTRLSGHSYAPYDDGLGGTGLNLGDHVGDDISLVSQNRALLNALLPSDVIFLSQIHGNIVVDASELDALPNANVVADASYAKHKRVVCAVLTADCLPILLSSLDGQFVAAIHAGWRGLAADVVENTIQTLRRQGAGELTAWLGPAIGPAAFEVGQDVYGEFFEKIPQLDRFMKTDLTVTGAAKKYYMDIYGVAREILKQQGVDRVYGGNYCTVTQSDLFYSYRRDQRTGRMANLIWKD
ncbi:peptidoglycan editing factor PgeF [Undibacterium sp. Di24W]|uniref:peptidoglycan editing factor PgeF n=1 Tax=Undibacterium sp. Di24W TaxID=3413033 RepID=UPI003BF12ED5